MTYEARQNEMQGDKMPGDERALQPLIEILLSRDPDQRRTAAFALGQIHHSQIVAPLIKALRDPDPEVRRWALLGLGRYRDPSAIPAMIISLREPGQPEREAAVTALTMMGTSAIPALAEALRHYNPDAACAAAETLGRIADPRAVSPLIRALKASEPRLRMAAAQAVGELAVANPAPEVRAALAPLRRLAWQEEGAFYRTIIRRIEGAIEPIVHLPIPATQPVPSAASLPVPSKPPVLEPKGLPIPARATEDNAEATTSKMSGRRLLQIVSPVSIVSRLFVALFRRDAGRERP